MKSQLQSLVRMEDRKYSMKRIVTMSVNVKRLAVAVLALCAIVPLALPAQTFTTLVRFNVTDGWLPNGPLIQSVQGDLYGTTYSGGATNYGTLFNMTPSGALTHLYNFCPQGSIPSCPNGAYPTALIQDTSGTLYGTTARGASTIGKYHSCTGICGTVFSVSVGLGPFMEAQPGSGQVGAAVHILGTNLTGATSVTFNGTAAKFTVVSSSEITTTVPAGSTTGEVQVVTPGGTLSSNVSFRVP